MGLDAQLRLRHKETGLLIDLDNYNGRTAFAFLREFMEARNLYGEFVILTDEDIKFLLEKGLESFKQLGYYPGDIVEQNWGNIGFLKQLALSDFYKRFGYILEVSCDW